MIDRSRWTVQYMQRVLATDPIGCWMQDEKQGLVSYDMVTARSDGARNGAYTAVTLAQPGIGDGRTSALYDGATSYDDIYSASLNAAFNGQAATIMAWSRVSAAGVWADGVQRRLIQFHVNNNNRIYIEKAVGANRIDFVYNAGGVSLARADATFAGSTAWFSAILTADLAADECRSYVNGIQTGATFNGLGIWVGALSAVRTLMGADTQVPALVWDGYLAHGAVWDRPLTPAEALSLGVL